MIQMGKSIRRIWVETSMLLPWRFQDYHIFFQGSLWYLPNISMFFTNHDNVPGSYIVDCSQNRECVNET